MGEKISNDISSESTDQIHSQKSCILLGRIPNLGLGGTMWDKFDNVILRSFGAIEIFHKLRFSKYCSFYTYDSFSIKPFYVLPVTVKRYFLEF